ncbi:MAG: hypothetical protein ACK4K7_12880 [Allosphingosinicella sp.]|uniref:hypothetical protein n=1 Tax=Allosphingosinicella sp. TaxID=2823234 RepID=UPI003957DA5C
MISRMPTLLIRRSEDKELLWLVRHLKLTPARLTLVLADRGTNSVPGPVGECEGPILVLDGGRRRTGTLPVMLHLAEGTPLVPADISAQAEMIEWMIWTQRVFQPAIAAGRRLRAAPGSASCSAKALALQQGAECLEDLAEHLQDRRFLLACEPSLADLLLLGTLREAPLAGFDLLPARPLWHWLARAELHFGIDHEQA